jgi:hypothetical protein
LLKYLSIDATKCVIYAKKVLEDIFMEAETAAIFYQNSGQTRPALQNDFAVL